MPNRRFLAGRSAAPVSDGWDMPLPVSANTSVYPLLHARQPGSRLFFINAQNGGIPTLAFQSDWIYFMVGGQIVDSTGSPTNAQGVAYGTDPYNPSPAVKRWRYWAACAITRESKPPGVRTGTDYNNLTLPCPGPFNIDPGSNSLDQRPDWYGLERASTLDLYDDLTAYKADCAPAFTSIRQSIGIGSGAGVGAESVLFSFGPLSDPMPRITSRKGWNFVAKVNTDWSHVRYLDLEINNYQRDADGDVTGAGWVMNASSTNGLTQGCHFYGCGQLNFVNTGDWTLRRSQVFDEHCLVEENNSGLDFHEPDNASHSGKLTLDDVDIGRNGMRWYNPKRVADGEQFPIHSASTAYTGIGTIVHNADRSKAYAARRASIPAGSVLPADDGQNIDWRHVAYGTRALGTAYDRNLYMAGRTKFKRVRVVAGASGEQFRRGAELDECYFQTGSVLLGNDSNGGALPSWVRNNVLEMYRHSAPHNGTGLALMNSLPGADVTQNIFTRAGQSDQTGGYGLEISYTKNASQTSDAYYRFDAPMANVSVYLNVIDCGQTKPIAIRQGWKSPAGRSEPTAAELSAWDGVGIYNTSVNYNVLISSSAAPDMTYPEPFYSVPLIGGNADNPVTATGNSRYTSRALAAAAKSYTDTERSMRTWLNSKGVTETDESFGRDVLIKIIRGETAYTGYRPIQRGNWLDEWQVVHLLNHVRAGWNFDALAVVADPGAAGISIGSPLQPITGGLVGEVTGGGTGLQANITSGLQGVGGAAAVTVDIAAAMGIAIAQIGGGLTGSLGDQPNITYTALSTVRIGRTPARIAAKRIGRKRP